MKKYLYELILQSEIREIEYVKNVQRTCYGSYYPFDIFPKKGFESIEFSPITVFYGSNGSGKTTLLNVIAEKLRLERHSVFSGGAFFPEYVKGCEVRFSSVPTGSQIITSDDITDYLIDKRHINKGVDTRREKLFDEYVNRKNSVIQLTNLDDYDEWRETNKIIRGKKSDSQFVRERLGDNVGMLSNGESAMKYYLERINEAALYLLDEPENSLSISSQLKLVEYLMTSARYYDCQFVISTHSPVVLSISGATIYDLDSYPVKTKRWTDLENVREYYNFFKKNEKYFEENN